MSTTEIKNELFEIFMPKSATMIKEAREKDTNFVHYTSAENAIKIIDNKEIWLRNTQCMNDFMEMDHGHDLLLNYFKKDGERNKNELFKNIGDVLATKILKSFDENWYTLKTNAFISCFSEHPLDEDEHGRLSMWRAYGGTSSKVAIVLNMPYEKVSEVDLLFVPVLYFDDADFEKDLDLVNKISNAKYLFKDLNYEDETIVSYILMILITYSACLKHKGFREEKEWRIIHFPTLHKADTNKNKYLVDEIETINGVPQNVYKIKLIGDPKKSYLNINKLVTKILIGPTEYGRVMKDAFEKKLSNASEITVNESNIPLRT